MIVLQALGATEVSRDGESLTLQPKRLALLAYLALGRPRGFHRRELLASLLWPETDDRHARNALSQSLHGLRDALGANVLLLRGLEALRIAPAALICDALVFEEDLDTGRSQEALESYRGELLEGLHVSGAIGFERWLEAERARLKRRAKDAARALAEREESAGNPVAAVRWLQRGVDISPSDETDVRRLISLLDRLGDRAGALRVYDDLARHLKVQYDATPAPETEKQVERVRTRSQASAHSVPHSPARTQSAEPGLAVLPLQNLTGDPQQDYFADGMTDTLITELARSKNLRVISRQSASSFKGSSRPLSEIAQRLGVDLLIEGSVLRAGNRVRISAQLLRAEPEEHLWADAFDGQLTNLLGLQREVARSIAREVAKLFGQKSAESVGSVRSIQPRAYEEFLRGVVRFPYMTPATFGEILGYFERSVELDENFAEAHAWIAFTWLNVMYGGTWPLHSAREKVMPSIDRALNLAPDLGSVHAIRAMALQAFDRDWAAVDSAWQKAIDLGGGDVHTYVPRSLFLTGMGRFEQAIAGAQEAIRINPLGPPEQFLLGWVLFRARRYDQAIEQLTWTLAQWPDYPWAAAFLAASQLFAGWPSKAIDTCRRALALPNLPTSLAYIAATLARAGEIAEARTIINGLENLEYIDPYPLAMAYAAMGDGDAMFNALERVVNDGSIQTWVLPVEVFFDPYRSDPRFDRIVEALDLPKLQTA